MVWWLTDPGVLWAPGAADRWIEVCCGEILRSITIRLTDRETPPSADSWARTLRTPVRLPLRW